MLVSGLPGTGTITLAYAATGYRSFTDAGVANGNVVSYLIEDSTNWELGYGTYTSSGATLSRDTVVASSAGGTTKIAVSSAAYVYITSLAADLVQYDSAGNVKIGGKLGIGTSSPAISLDINATDAIHLPAGTTAQRPTGVSGYLRYNSTTASLEAYSSFWGSIVQLDANGDLLLGDTVSNGAKLQVKGSIFATDRGAPTSGAGLEVWYNGTQCGITSYNRTSSTYLGLLIEGNTVKFNIGATEAGRFDASGNFVITGSGRIGYGTGSGGAVTQATSRTTGVTINKPNGAITMFTAAGATTAATFTVTNSIVEATDVVVLSQKSGTNLYDLMVTAVAAGSFNITFRTTGGTASDAPVINFAVIKAVNA